MTLLRPIVHTLLLLLLILLIFTMVVRSLTRTLGKLVSADFSSLIAPNAGPQVSGCIGCPKMTVSSRS